MPESAGAGAGAGQQKQTLVYNDVLGDLIHVWTREGGKRNMKNTGQERGNGETKRFVSILDPCWGAGGGLCEPHCG